MYSSGEDSFKHKFRNGDCDHVMTMGFVIVIVIIFVTLNPEYAIGIIIIVSNLCIIMVAVLTVLVAGFSLG